MFWDTKRFEHKEMHYDMYTDAESLKVFTFCCPFLSNKTELRVLEPYFNLL